MQMKQWFKRRKISTQMWIAIVSFGLLLLGGIAMFNTYEVDPALVKQNPEWLSNKRVTGELPEGSLVIENAVIKNATFVDFRALDSTIKNVVFEDCRFVKANFMKSEFENVTFKGGLMTNKGDPYYESNRSNFNFSVFKNIIMDGFKMENPNLYGMGGAGTRLLLINMDMQQVPYPLMSFNDVHVRIKNCNIQGKGALVLTSGPGSVYATDSTFDGAGFLCRSDVAYVENCKLLNRVGMEFGKTIIIKNSVISGPVGGFDSDMVYLINNSYAKTGKEMGGIAIMGGKKTKIYLDGRNKKNASVNILGGGAYVKDLEIIEPVMRRIETVGEAIEPHTLDLNNVTIRSGRISTVRLKGGRWQDVTIYPPVKANNAQIKNVQTYNVKFPDGEPWTETDGNTKIEFIPSSKPFDFPEIKAPTPEELGLVD